MPFDRLRSLRQRPSFPATASVSMRTRLSAPSPRPWSSTHQDFTSLRFFVWTGGDTGFTLTTTRQSEDKAYSFIVDEDAELRVDRVTALKVWKAGIRPGDILETVSDKRVHTMDTEAALVLIRMSKCPSIIRFRSSTSCPRIRFDVPLGHQKLGVFFTGDGHHDIPIVTRIDNQTSLHNFNRDSISSSSARLGDVLVAVNGKDVVADGLKATMQYLETCPRPVKLTFERPANDDNASECFDTQVASEDTREHDRGSFFRHNSIDMLGTTAREAVSHCCKNFSAGTMPNHSALSLFQQQTKNRAGGHKTHDNVVIEWKRGPLGLTLMEDAISGVPIVNRLTGKGSSANMELLQHGFQLCSVNGARSEGRLLKDLYRDLSMLPKPVKLVFCRVASGGTSGEGSASQRTSASSFLPISSEIVATRKTDRNEEASRELNMAPAAQGRRTQQAPSICEHYEYEVVWTSTRLGLQLEIPHNSERQPAKTNKVDKMSTQCQYPIVYKVLKESTLGLPSDAVGHLFVSINNWHTSGLEVEELRTLLQVAPKPALLRFRRCGNIVNPQRTFMSSFSPEMDEESMANRRVALSSAYSIVWSKGKLGIVFGCYEDANRRNTLVVYVKSIGPGPAQNSKLVAVGDILCSINGRDLPPKQKFKKTIHLLVNISQPVTLGFCRLYKRCADFNEHP